MIENLVIEFQILADKAISSGLIETREEIKEWIRGIVARSQVDSKYVKDILNVE